MSNIVIIEGHLGADVELKSTTTNGVAVVNIRVATNRKYTNKQGQLVDDSQWHNVVCWDKLAVNVAQFMHKGSHVLVEGRLENREFMGQAKYENGQVVVDGVGNPIMVKRYTTEIVARNVTFLDKKPTAATYPQVVGAAVQPAVAPQAAFVKPTTAPLVAPVATAPVVAANPAAVAGTFVGAPAAENVIQPVVIPGV